MLIGKVLCLNAPGNMRSIKDTSVIWFSIMHIYIMSLDLFIIVSAFSGSLDQSQVFANNIVLIPFMSKSHMHML